MCNAVIDLIYPSHLHTAATLSWRKLIWCLHLSARWCVRMAYTSDDQAKLLQRKNSKFIPSDSWPPNSPHLNPVYYWVSGIMQDRVYASLTYRRPRAALGWHLEWLVAKHCERCYWWMV